MKSNSYLLTPKGYAYCAAMESGLLAHISDPKQRMDAFDRFWVQFSQSWNRSGELTTGKEGN